MDLLRRRAMLAMFASSAASCAIKGPSPSLLNASYEATAELFEVLNARFTRRTGAEVFQSHGGSGKQGRAVLDGLPADVVTLALGFDIDALVKGGLVAKGWASRFPFGASPYTSTIAILVRKGNPKAIRDFEDLARRGVAVIAPSPKTSGGARWNFLAVWGAALKKSGGDRGFAKDLVTRLYRNVPVLDTGARGATTTFVERGLGDALLTWENEARFAALHVRPNEVFVVTPSVSILAEPPIAIVDRVVDRRGTRALADDYLRSLYDEEAQRIIAAHHFRPRIEAASSAATIPFPEVARFPVSDLGGWDAAQREHFAEGGTFDRIFT